MNNSGEVLKFKSSNIFWLSSFSFLIFSFIPIFLLLVLDVELTPLQILQEIYYFNMQITYPLISIIHFSWFFSNDYEKNRIRFYKSSSYSTESIFTSKILVGLLSFLIIQLPTLLLLLGIWLYNFGLTSFICRKAFYTDKKEAKKGNVIQQT